MKTSLIGTGTDMFVVHVFQDGTRPVLVTWGIGAQGTLASGVWLVSNFSTFSTLTLMACTCTSGPTAPTAVRLDGFPQPGEITLLYQGN